MKKCFALLFTVVGAFALLGQGLTIRSAFYLPSIKAAYGSTGITKIFDVAKQGNASECTTNANSTGSTVIFWGVSGYTTPPTLNDQTNGVNTGNTWLQLTNIGTSGNYIALYCCTNPVVGTNHSFTLSGGDGTSLMAEYIAGFSGQTTAPVAGDSKNASSSGHSTTIQPGSVTGKLHVTVIKAVCPTGGQTLSIDSGFSILSQGEAPSQYLSGMAYKIQTSSTAENPTWTVTGIAPDVTADISTLD